MKALRPVLFLLLPLAGAWTFGALRSSPEERVVELFERLADLGDERQMSLLSRVAIEGPFTRLELERVIAAAFRGIERWNDDLPAWKWALLNRLSAWGGAHATGSYCELHPEFLQVRFRFRARGGDHRKLYLEGNWNQAGRIAALGGWSAAALSNAGASAPGEGGVWSSQVSLQRSPFGHYYHAVVRTAPWPAGRAVGWGRFRAERGKPNEVWIDERSAPSPAPLPAAGSDPKKVRLAVIGIDGASWHLLLPFIHRGALPHLSRLLREGAPARLTSVGGRYHYASMPNIHTALTGYLPFRHQTKKDHFGVIFRKPVPRLWHWLSADGLRSTLVGIWGTIPVERLHGWVVSEAYFFTRYIADPVLLDLLASPWTVQFARSFGVEVTDIRTMLSLGRWVHRYVETTYPSSMSARLDALDPPVPLSRDADIAEVSWQMYDREIYKVCRRLAEERPTLLLTYLIDMDARSHLSWQAFEPLPGVVPRGKSDSRDLLRSLQRMDRFLGEVMGYSRNLLIFSDHGMSVASAKEYSPFYKFDPARAVHLFERTSGRRAPPGLAVVEIDKGRFELSAGADGAEFLSQLEAFLAGLRYRKSGARPFTLACRNAVTQPLGAAGHVVCAGTVAPFGKLDESVLSASRDYPLEEFFTIHAIASDHAGNGMLLLWGADVAPGPVREEAYIADVTPTALALLGQPVSADFDGVPLLSALKDPRPPQRSARTPRPPNSLLSLIRSFKWERLLRRIADGPD